MGNGFPHYGVLWRQQFVYSRRTTANVCGTCGTGRRTEERYKCSCFRMDQPGQAMKHRFTEFSPCGSLAQWQSVCLVNRRSRVQFSQEPTFLVFFDMDTHACVLMHLDRAMCVPIYLRYHEGWAMKRHSIQNSPCGSLAQWQSVCLVNRRSRVQFSQEPYFLSF